MLPQCDMFISMFSPVTVMHLLMLEHVEIVDPLRLFAVSAWPAMSLVACPVVAYKQGRPYWWGYLVMVLLMWPVAWALLALPRMNAWGRFVEDWQGHPLKKPVRYWWNIPAISRPTKESSSTA